MDEAGLLGDVERVPGEVIVSVRCEVDVGARRVGTPAHRGIGLRITNGEPGVLHDAVVTEVALQDLGVTPERTMKGGPREAPSALCLSTQRVSPA